YREYLTGRARATSAATVQKYDATLRSFIQSLERHGDPATLEALTPLAVNRWVREQRAAGRSEHGIASRLSALKVFSRGYVFNSLELTTCDLLRKVARITPPEQNAPVLSEDEIEWVLDSFDRPTFE